MSALALRTWRSIQLSSQLPTLNFQPPTRTPCSVLWELGVGDWELMRLVFGPRCHRLLAAGVAGREDDVQRYQRLQRVAVGFGEWPDVIAHLAALADVDHRLGGFALLAVEVVLVAHLFEVVDDAVAQVLAVLRLE